NNSKGSTVTVLPALSHDVEFLRIGVFRFAANGVNSSTLLDIMIDRAGGASWETDPLIPNLTAGSLGGCYIEYTQYPAGITCWYNFPIWIPAGASLGVRGQTAHTSDITTGRVIIQAAGGNRNPASWWCGQRVTAIGIDTSYSIGELIPTAAAPSWGAWTNVGSALASDAYAVQMMMQGEGDSSLSNSTIYTQIGVSNTQIGPNLVRATNTYESGAVIMPGPIFCALPAGTQLQARASRVSGSNDDVDVVIYAVH
ncbi:MAG: hypothetical protein P8Y36_07255, partial [Alphaproteobacteria bacterium]